MIKKQQKWIALFVALTFAWMLQISAMPVAAADSAAQADSIRAEQGPDHYEAVSHKSAPAKKKSILPWILIGVGVLAVTAAVLFLVVLKTKYDPVGSWSGPMSSWTAKVVFSGSKKSGTILYTDPSITNLPGTYTVDKENIVIKLSLPGYPATMTGVFNTEDQMSGTWKYDSSSSNAGNWTLNRIGTAAQQPSIQKLASGQGINSGN